MPGTSLTSSPIVRTYLLLVVVVACTEPARAPEPVRPTTTADARIDANNLGAVPIDASPVASGPMDAGPPAGPTSCPAAFGDIPDGTPCSTSLRCPYARGTCTCAPGQYCGGAAPPPDIEAQFAKLRWTCTPNPPAIRPDGCPGTEPRGGRTRCSKTDQQCVYGDCCVIQYRCTNGTWIGGASTCPP